MTHSEIVHAPEVCRAHRDPSCQACDVEDDDLWINPRDLHNCRKCGNEYDPENSFYDDESLCPGCGDAEPMSDTNQGSDLANALLGAEEILEVLHLRGTRGVEQECSAGRIADVYRNVQAAKQHLT